MNHLKKFNESSKIGNNMDYNTFMEIVALGYENARYDNDNYSNLLDEDSDEYFDMLYKTWLSETGEELRPEQYRIPFVDRDKKWNESPYTPPKQTKETPFNK